METKKDILLFRKLLLVLKTQLTTVLLVLEPVLHPLHVQHGGGLTKQGLLVQVFEVLIPVPSLADLVSIF